MFLHLRSGQCSGGSEGCYGLVNVAAIAFVAVTQSMLAKDRNESIAACNLTCYERQQSASYRHCLSRGRSLF